MDNFVLQSIVVYGYSAIVGVCGAFLVSMLKEAILAYFNVISWEEAGERNKRGHQAYSDLVVGIGLVVLVALAVANIYFPK